MLYNYGSVWHVICVINVVERGLRLRRRNVNTAGDTRHDRWGTASGSEMTCGDRRELEYVNNGKFDELAWRSQTGTRDTESTGCVIWQARELVDRCACECYERRGMVYLCQTCWADNLWGLVSKICHVYGVKSRVTGVMAACHGIRVVSCSECL